MSDGWIGGRIRRNAEIAENMGILFEDAASLDEAKELRDLADRLDVMRDGIESVAWLAHTHPHLFNEKIAAAYRAASLPRNSCASP